jgi:SAM-dependent methyltransferase
VYAPEIDRQWGTEEDDFAVISNLLDRYRPLSVLDVGCGSGRLFGVYLEHRVPCVLGLDISEKALALANEKYPDIPTCCKSVEDITFPRKKFDLLICNRTLQHIPPDKIADVIRRLCFCTDTIYINEITKSEGLIPDSGLFIHDYPDLFLRESFVAEISGDIPKGQNNYQHYVIFRRE